MKLKLKRPVGEISVKSIHFEVTFLAIICLVLFFILQISKQYVLLCSLAQYFMDALCNCNCCIGSYEYDTKVWWSSWCKPDLAAKIIHRDGVGGPPKSYEHHDQEELKTSANFCYVTRYRQYLYPTICTF